jgi:hypothetical protein
MKKLEKLTLKELEKSSYLMGSDELTTINGGGYWYWSQATGWTYMLDEVTVSGSCDLSLDIGTVQGGVTINNTDSETLSMALSDPMSLAVIAKQRYFAQYGVDLNISDESLRYEIYWHAWLYNNGIATDHTGVSNCGDAEHDSNRWIWDLIP